MGLKWLEQRKYQALAEILLIILTLAEVWIGLNWFHAPIANSTPATFDQLVKLLYKEGRER